MKLCVRWTFFDETAAERSTAVHRSHSSPPCVPANVARSSYDKYVAELLDKADSLTSLQSQFASSTAPELKHRQQKSNLIVESTPLSVSNDGGSLRYETNLTVDAIGGDSQVSCSDSTTIPQTAGLQNDVVAKTVLLSKALDDAVPEPCVPACKPDLETKIPGNWGHPELCNRPCIFFARGGCANGESCRFCHLAHSKAPHLDKRERALLKAMTSEQRASLIVPLVARKAAALQLQEQVSELLMEEFKTNALGFATLPENWPSGVMQSMEKMSMRQLLSMAVTGDARANGLQTIKDHIDQMRLVMKDSFRFLEQ